MGLVYIETQFAESISRLTNNEIKKEYRKKFSSVYILQL